MKFSFPLCLASIFVASSLAAHAAPDEDALGKSSGYPVQRFGSSFSIMKEEFKVGTFSNMEKVFWPRAVTAAGSTPLQEREGTFNPTYPFEGRNYSVDDFLARQRITGLLILKDGQIVLERYQYGRQPEDRLTSFSMAKTVVGLLVGIAQRDKKIASLDDSAEKYAPDLKGSAWGQVSVRNLLRMSSGVNWSDKVVPGVSTQIGRFTEDTFYQRGHGGASAISYIRDASHPQGTHFNYNSAETFALGLVLKGATGQDLATYLSEKIWKPMGAESDASWLIDRSGMEAANCCINARLRDFGRLGALLANDGVVDGKEVIPREYLLDATEASRQPDYMKPRKATQFFGYGYQTWHYPYRTRTFEARGLFGQQLIVQPDSKVVIVIMSALKTPDVPSDIFVERNYFSGAVIKALGGQADLYR